MLSPEDHTDLKNRLADLEAREAALREENNYLRELYHHSSLAYQSLDENGNFIEVNQVWLDSLGYSRDEVIGQNFADFLHPSERNNFKENFHKYKVTGKVLDIEVEILKKDNSYLYVSLHGNIQKTSQGLFQKTYCFFKDISRQKQAEKALTYSEGKWRNIIVSTPQVGISLDPHGRIVFANTEFLKMVGWQEQEVINRDWFDMFIPVHIRDKVRNTILSAMGQKQIFDFSNYENEIVTKTGELRNIAWSNVLSKDIDGNVTDITCLGIDLTERQRAMEALQKSENRHRVVFENSPLGMIYFNQHGTIANCNQKFVEQMASSREKLIGFSTATKSTPEIREALKKALNGKVSSYEGSYTSVTGGRTFYLRVLFNPVNPGKVPTEVIATLEDITERKTAEEEKKKLEKQLIHAQKLEAIGTLAGGIAHDFNNILGIILGYTEMARDDSPSGSKVTKDLDKVMEAGFRARDLVQQILTFSRQVDSSYTVFHPAEIVQESTKILRPLLPATIQIKQDIDPQAGPLLADLSHFHQIVMNLCTNAFHAMEETGGTLVITLNNILLDDTSFCRETGVQPGNYCHLQVKDSGMGITPATQERMFEPFFTTKGVGKGTGMGLSTVHGIVKNYKGGISCESSATEGTTFHVYLPVNSQAVDVPQEVSQDKPIDGKQILFVDDEQLLLEMGTAMLKRMGHHVTARQSSKAALETFLHSPGGFDLVITDQTMPEMTGFELAGRILQIRPDLPIILCTGYSSVISAEQAKSLGIREFVLKPLTQKDMRQTLSTIFPADHSMA